MGRTIVHRGRKIQVAVDVEAGPRGGTVQRDVVIHPGAVAILPLTDDGRIYLLRNRRPIVDEVLWEVPAGTLEPGEPVETAAARELAEETGYNAAAWRRLADFYPSPGVLSEKTVLFVARGLTPGAMSLEDDEQLEPVLVPWTEAVSMALAGTIRDAKTLVAILLWDRLKEESVKVARDG
jgi:ADP-ribose pyrophosphatase